MAKQPLVVRDQDIVKLENQLLPEYQQGALEVGTYAFEGPLPSYLDDDEAGAGTEAVKVATSRPRLDLMHATTPRVRAKDAEEGQFYHTTDDQLLDTPIRFIPCMVSEAAILWRPRNMGGGRLAIARDILGAWEPSNEKWEVTPDNYGDGDVKVTWDTKGSVQESRLLDWGSMDPKNPKAGGFAGTSYVNVLAYFPDYPHLQPAVIGFSKSGYNEGAKLSDQLKGLAKTKGKAAYSCLFQLKTRWKKHKKGDFLVPVVEGIGWAAPGDRLRAKAIYGLHKHDHDFTDAALAAEAAGSAMPSENGNGGLNIGDI